MRGALGVRINDGHSDRVVTSRTRDLRFRKTAPGGHHSASCTVDTPRGTFHDLGPNDRLYVTDTRTARTVWEGYTDNPGITDGPAGQSYDITAMGGMALASDRSEVLPYLDRSLDQWRRDDYNPQAPSGTGEAGQFPGDAGTRAGKAGLYVQLTPGQPITDGSQTGMTYDQFLGSTMTLGAFAGWMDAGMTDSGYQLRWTAQPFLGGQGEHDAVQLPLSGIGDVLVRYAGAGAGGGSDLGAGLYVGKTGLTFHLYRYSGGATNVASDNVWGAFGELVILGHLMDRYGSLRDMKATAHVHAVNPDTVTGYVLPHEIVEDVFGRLLGNRCEPTLASIATTTTYQIDQLVWRDAASAAEVFDALNLYEPDYLWEILEVGGPNGKHRFNFRKWPTTPRYTISTADGYSAPGGEADLCNRIAVSWTDSKGSSRTTVVTQNVPELGGDPAASNFAGRVRDADAVTLPDGHGSAANATQVGKQILAQKAAPPKAGSATLARPILDRLTGRRVMPWEIEPGYLVSVRETGDLLRLTEMEYVDSDGATTLTLGNPVRTTEQIIASLSRKVSS